MTQLTVEEHEMQMSDMKSFDEEMSCVWIFWYEPQIQRGRVAWNIDKFTVLAGHWAEPIHDIIF